MLSPADSFLPMVDQMVQAARSGKQNIVEGSADGVTSMELEIKLLNVARASIQELLEDFEDYLPAHRLTKWTQGHPRFEQMMTYCRDHNRMEDYEPYFEQWTDEEMANIGITLCRMVDKMMLTYQEKKQQEFVTQGGIKERMHAARTGYRQEEQNELHALRQQIKQQAEEIEYLQSIIKAHGITI